MIPDSSQRTVRIPVRWIDGRWLLEDGGDLPDVAANAHADLVIPAVFLTNEEQRARWSDERVLPLLKKGAHVFARLTLARIPPNLLERTEEKPHTGVARRYVRIILNDELFLHLTPGKKGRLSDCQCRIPAISDEARSINESYKKIVTLFEPTRRSNSGNVFSVVWSEEGGRFISLDYLRDQVTEAALSDEGSSEAAPKSSPAQRRLPGVET